MEKIAAVQTCGGHIEKEKNLAIASDCLLRAAEQGAQILCLPEMFNTPYFCYEENDKYFEFAESIPGPTIEAISAIAKKTQTVIISPIFEKVLKGEYYNTAVVIGPKGEIIGRYRKMSIPYVGGKARGKEKYYFKPGNLGFPVFSTPFDLRIGILICYDRHFPEAARAIALGGADILFVPTCTWGFSQDFWDLELRAHARANSYFVCGVNKAGVDVDGSPDRKHFGASLVINPKGETMARVEDEQNIVLCAEIDIKMVTEERLHLQFFRDRRPDAYGSLVEK
jgi:N-carbamoylputrescine amidase